MGLNCFGISFSSQNITLDSDSTHQKLSKSDYHAIWKKWEKTDFLGEGENRDMAVKAMKIHLKNKNATELNLNNLGLRSLPDILPPCTTLNVSNNYLTELPLLPANLTHLNLANNQLTKLSGHFPLPGNLTHLDLANNQLTDLSDYFPLQGNLTHLDLANNQLVELPMHFLTQLDRLEKFTVAYNKLTELPELPNTLESLNADNNQLNYLPDTLPTSLRLITASNNQITQLPEAIFNLFNDSKIVLKNNPLTEKTYYLPYGSIVPNISVSPSCLTKIEYLSPKPLSEIVRVWLTPGQQKSLENKWLEIEQEPGAEGFSKFLNQLANIKKSSIRPNPNLFLRELSPKIGGMDSWLYNLVNSYHLRQKAFLDYGH
ncbi:leucine-rich repeat domain-containing protein [Yersinia pseudotuberculosis]|uniref:leucine-rich repeat domain-containing protein n=1 Tax=Yersinia pseudotuberculosis TaxID=633 RepID=UPI0005E670D8|nr:leucine-rich repeat domain-containing protein [Yersinia pseudotuberculosis]CNC40027.1 leucine rich repeat domain-containing protein [Yersinia pseudotuberculosis]